MYLDRLVAAFVRRHRIEMEVGNVPLRMHLNASSIELTVTGKCEFLYNFRASRLPRGPGIRSSSFEKFYTRASSWHYHFKESCLTVPRVVQDMVRVKTNALENALGTAHWKFEITGAQEFYDAREMLTRARSDWDDLDIWT